ncbi:MAG: DoxX family protein [Planctomycetes bacterium]|nr:DoxX family protein [Planctomycetota bacterium]
MTKLQTMTSWAAQVIAALILGQTLFFKFSAAPESVAIFEALGAEPWGRIGSGIFELLAVILLLSPRFAVYGSVLTMGVMTGAIGAHLTKLGIEVEGDGGTLFVLALITFTCATLVTILRRRQLPFLKRA